MSSQNKIGVILAIVVALSAAAVILSRDTRAAEGTMRAADVNVSCGPTQRAIVQQTMAGGAPQVHVVCTDGVAPGVMSNAVPMSGAFGGQMQPVAYMPAAHPAMTPAVLTAAPVPMAVAPEIQQVRRAPARRAAAKPSTRQRLLVIGGAAGAGAGIGALVGGKKGALIGAAIGGGGAAAIDQIKHR
jgi:hypothetical protein